MELINQENIEDRIFTIRSMQVMLDRDLAELYLKDLGKKPVVSDVESWFAFSRMDSMTALLVNQLNNVR
jgi:hypothetical protein